MPLVRALPQYFELTGYIGGPTLKGFLARRTLSGFKAFALLVPRVVAALQPWAEISQRLRRIILKSAAVAAGEQCRQPRLVPNPTLRVDVLGEVPLGVDVALLRTLGLLSV